MDIFTLAMWIITIIFALYSFIRDKDKTINALKNAVRMGRSMVLNILTVILIIGLVLAFIPAENIASFIESQNPIIATVGSALVGAITLIPAFIAFPLVGTLVDASINIVAAVAFLTTLTMVGIVTFPLEKKEFGLKFAISRNVLSFIFAILIALVMGAIL
ncbi:MAG: permease [Pleomorphochaeta sp.]